MITQRPATLAWRYLPALLTTVACGSGTSQAAHATHTTRVPPGITITTRVLPTAGRILIAGNGRTLYVYTHDRRRSVTCTPADDCTKAWPPLLAGPGARAVAGPGVRNPLIDADNSAADGGRVITYNGWPLYFFIGDNGPGQDNGQGQGHDWYVISPSGQVIGAPAR
ncbi:MAG TPA: hypothetical protein VLW50_17475 [Streptosporangiaceae bacterium]|nr:hypothetical protein [Streptosporangiaceae bacterium]